jgi:hypothetical protein
MTKWIQDIAESIKNTFYKLYLFIIRLSLYLVFILRIDTNWSRIYRFLYQREYKNKPLSKYKNYMEIYEFIRTQIWVSDGFKELWNAYAYPSYFESNGNKMMSHDCDEFALYQATAIENAVKEGTFCDKNIKTYMMSVLWADGRKLDGHNVCLIEFKNGYKWVDYHLPSQMFDSVEQVIKDVLSIYTVNGILTGAVIRNTDLSLHKAYWVLN